jgi:Uma2 family endonuclease
MVGGDPVQEEPVTIAYPLATSDLVERLLGRDDLTIDDISELPEDLHYELIEGRLVLTPFAKPIHQLVSKNVGYAIDVNCPDEFILNIEQAVLIAPHIELRPDVMLLSERSAESSPVPPSDVLLVVEVISKPSRKTDREYKLERYAQGAIPNYWIIDPLAERITFTQFVLGPGDHYAEKVHTDGLVTVREPWEITLDLPAWTRRRDKLRANARPRG